MFGSLAYSGVARQPESCRPVGGVGAFPIIFLKKVQHDAF